LRDLRDPLALVAQQRLDVHARVELRDFERARRSTLSIVEVVPGEESRHGVSPWVRGGVLAGPHLCQRSLAAARLLSTDAPQANHAPPHRGKHEKRGKAEHQRQRHVKGGRAIKRLDSQGARTECVTVGQCRKNPAAVGVKNARNDPQSK
jgi:hypothetical protein